MKLSLNWIKDYVKMPDDMDLSRLAYDLTMSCVEVEGVFDLGKSFDKIVVGHILEVLVHPNADKLRICRTDIGDGEIKEIVCGGSNLEKGMKVVVACPGAMVRWHGEGDLVEIKNATLRGVKSFGMICASVEIGLADLFPAKEEHEIMDITSLDAPAGANLADVLGLRDMILEIDNKSMTNRPDLWGHYGIAREIAAMYDLPLVEFKPFDSTGIAPFDVRIENEDCCPRYIGAKIEGLSVVPSDFEMQSRIWRVGMRPINALVDITNYVMLALGQPTHVFDSDHISDYINVRNAKNGEKLELLNDKDIELCEDDLVISDSTGAVALAGVMGGAKDSVLPTTDSVILEVANFESTGVRRTALRYDNRTEASSRYEKAIDPERCDAALSMACELFKKYYPEMKVTAFSDVYKKKLQRAEIDVELDWLHRRLGKSIPREVILNKLGKMGYEITFSDNSMHIVVPTWRSTGDVSIKADIMEEVARMWGYENFEATSITTSFDGAINQLEVDLVRRIKEFLAFRAGMQEIFTYPWMLDSDVEAVLGSTEGILALSTPPAPDEKYIRSSLLPNICRAVVKNERNFSSFEIFEEAQIFKDTDYTSPYDESEKLPLQERHLGCAIAGKAENVGDMFRRAKGVFEEMASYVHMHALEFRREEKPVWADDVVWLNVYTCGKKVGDIGLISRRAALGCSMKVLTCVLAEINLDALVPLKSRTNRFTRLPEFPFNEYDISFLVDSSVKWEEIYNTVVGKKSPESLLKEVEFVDEYRGKQVPDGKKSVTIRLIIASSEKTLTSAEIETVANSAIKKLSKTLGADVRGK